MLKLNLGCGNKIKKNFVNLDKFETFKPDIVHDLEKFPYPFKDNSADYILLSHILEHIGNTFEIFNNIIKELYRISVNNCIIEIRVNANKVRGLNIIYESNTLRHFTAHFEQI